MNKDTYYIAHTPDTKTYNQNDNCQLLCNHLENVAQLCRINATAFDASNEAYCIGLLHDSGKYSKEFQQYIRGQIKSRVDHATYGGIKIINELPQCGEYFAMAIVGHHSGLKNSGNKHSICEDTFYARLNRYDLKHYHIEEDISFPIIKKCKQLKMCNADNKVHNIMSLTIATYIRFLFSSLVDADWIDTEAYVKKSTRQLIKVDFSSLYNKLINAIPDNDGRYINNIRADILRQCIKVSNDEQGIFTLNVPTGGGKTLSSLAFAINHAKKHNLSRIIYVIPYTSIIQQNAKVTIDALGEDIVLEHHSNKIYPNNNKQMQWASENWDIPIIFTTNVQFFESMYSSKPSMTRKLHNIANSVVIFDEVQMIPIEYISPCYYAICELVNNYNVTAVLSSATMPNVDKYLYKDISIKEIISNSQQLHQKLQRVEYEYIGAKSDDKILLLLEKYPQCLIIVNSRRHAYELYNKAKMTRRNVFHLSTLMTPYHRNIVIKQIREYLNKNEPITVISTQLIEAGVDIDFPIVSRSIAGIDSIIQAGGRANREGKLDKGNVYVFEPEDSYAKIPKAIQPYAALSKEVISILGKEAFSQKGILSYYEKLYLHTQHDGIIDSKSILSQFYYDGSFTLNFETASKNFKFIDNNTYSIYIENSQSKELLGKLKEGYMNYAAIRQLGLYSVNIYEYELKRLMDENVIEEIAEGIFVLNNDRYYSNDTGLEVFSEDNLNAECYMT